MALFFAAGWWKIFFKGEGGFVSFFKCLKLLDAAFRMLSLFVVAEFSPSVTTSYFILLIQESVKNWRRISLTLEGYLKTCFPNLER